MNKSERPYLHIEQVRNQRKQTLCLIGAVLMLICFAAALANFYTSSQALRQAIQAERMVYVEEISAEINSQQRFMNATYSGLAANYARLLERAEVARLDQVRYCLPGLSGRDMLLLGADGELIDLDGQAVYLGDRLLQQRLAAGDDVVQLFSALNYSDDRWLFAAHIDGVVCEGMELAALVLAVPAEDFRDNLAIPLFDDHGASYIIANDGSIRIRSLRASQTFAGYNLFSAMLRLGADPAQVAALEEDIWKAQRGSAVLKISGEDWLISHNAIDAENSILVAVPLSVTATNTYDGLSNNIGTAVATVAAIALSAIFLILFFFFRDQRRRREAAAVAAKSDFFAKMSHDIRTPLNAVIGLELLARDCAEDPQVREYLGQSSAAANYLLSIINDVLDMSRIESGKLALAQRPVRLSQLVEDVAAIVRSLAADKSLDFQVENSLPPEQVYWLDPVRLKQVLMNLLSNAVKFSHLNGQVRFSVSCRRDENRIMDSEDLDQVTFTVSDDGVGMSRDFLARIFIPFEQERSSFTQQSTGSGLGLAIVHSLVQLMGGTVAVTSQEEVGSTFTVRLPLRLAAEAEADESIIRPIATESRFAGHRVLLAEDNYINQQVALALLTKRFDLSADLAEDGQQAVKMFAASPPGYYDLILMDVKMPRMNGLEATRAIRRLERPDADRIPILALSANAFAEDVAVSLQSGMNAHLSKPIDIDLMGAALRRFIKNEEEKE